MSELQRACPSYGSSCTWVTQHDRNKAKKTRQEALGRQAKNGLAETAISRQWDLFTLFQNSTVKFTDWPNCKYARMGRIFQEKGLTGSKSERSLVWPREGKGREDGNTREAGTRVWVTAANIWEVDSREVNPTEASFHTLGKRLVFTPHVMLWKGSYR